MGAGVFDTADVKKACIQRVRGYGMMILIVLSAIVTPPVLHVEPPFFEITPGQVLAQSGSEGTANVKHLMEKGQRYLDSGNFTAAVPVYQRALQICIRRQMDDSIEQARKGLASALLLTGNPLKAIPLFEQLVEHEEIATIQAAYLSNLGLSYFQAGHFIPAERALQRAIRSWDSIRGLTEKDLNKITLFEQQAHSYRLLQKVLVAQGRYEDALVMSEQSRARALVEQLVQGLGAIPTPPPTLAGIKQIAKDHDTTLIEYSVVGKEVRVLGTEPATETDLYIWVVKPSGEIFFRQVALESKINTPLRSLVISARSEILHQGDRVKSGLGRSSKPDVLKKLYNLLIASIADLLPANPDETITVIPHGPLFLLPFASLLNPAGEYVIQAHTLLASPSIQALGLTKRYLQQQKRQGNILVVANPTMPQFPDGKGRSAESLAQLPGAEREGEAIAALYNTVAITGDDATEDGVVKRLGSFQIIHLATHGLLDVDADLNEFGEIQDPEAPTARDFGVYINPGGVIVGDNVFIGGIRGKEAQIVIGGNPPEGMIPAKVALAREKVVRVELPGLLAFAPGSSEDGFLTAKEIVQLSLDTELVVMSACDTGRGRVTGDGVVGLARSFMAAGVPSVVMSLWSVPDMTTATLMVEFYKNLRRKNDKAHALRDAMLTVMKRHPHPIDWAGFVLMGEDVSFCSNVPAGSSRSQ